MKKFSVSVFYVLFPFSEAYFANKKINKLIANLENMEFEKYRKFSELQTEYENTYKRKDKFEDKAKINVISVTLTITLIMGSLTIIKEFMNSQNFFGINFIAITLFVFSVFYMIVAGINAFSLLMDRNTVYISKLDESNLVEIEQAVLGNNYYNLIRNNLINSSYKCIRNALIYMFIVMLILIANQFESIENSKAVATSTLNMGIFYSSGVIDRGRFYEIKPKIEYFIKNNTIVNELDVGVETGIVDLDNKVFIKLVKNIDNSIHVVLVEQFESK